MLPISIVVTVMDARQLTKRRCGCCATHCDELAEDAEPPALIAARPPMTWRMPTAMPTCENWKASPPTIHDDDIPGGGGAREP